MNYQEWVDVYIEELKDTKEVKTFLEVKERINQKYQKEILAFKNAEAKYLDMKEHPLYYSNPNEIQMKFVEMKKNLYEYEEVQMYFKLEKEIQNILNQDLNEIKNVVSNKFVLNNNIDIIK